MSEELKEKKKKEKKVKAKKSKLERRRGTRRFFNTLMGIVIFCTLLGVASGVSTIYLILNKSDVILDLAALGSTESSFIYDSKGNEIARLGVEDRVNITYMDLPQNVIDAFIAVEDSRYFEHPGFDMPRFAKAFLINLRTFSFSQGGSTITMQVIKNSYFAVDTIAVSSGGGGISRKVQEIYYSLKINNLLSKGRILELYINKINYGGTARGIEVAADYYFGKSARDLNLVEAAYLAGVVNAPNDYNAYYYPYDAQIRTGDVLYQMHNHGYITDEEYKIAEKIDIVNLLAGKRDTEYSGGKTIKNQAFLDVVINELEDLYDINVYTDSVRVYTSMNPTLQSLCDKISDGKVVAFPDKYVNYASAIVQNKTGLIMAICGGRDYDRARRYNYAVDSRVQPGSTSKAIITYPLGFEYGGISNASYILDEKIYYTGTNIAISNYGGGYHGWVNVEQAFSQSFNIPAIKVLRKARAAVGDAKIRSYLRAIGLDDSVAEAFNEQFAIGGMDCLISPLQLASAGAVMLNGGKYITPHTITKIEFINSTKEPIIPNYTSTQVISAGAAWQVSNLMRITVSGVGTQPGVGSPGRARLFRRSYTMYGKTGTTSLPDYMLKKLGIGSSTTAGKDLWLLISNGDYTMGSWYGYDLSAHANKYTWFSAADQALLIDGKIGVKIFDTIEKAFGKPKNSNPRPSDVTSIRMLKGVEPYTAPPSYAPAKTYTSGFILSKFAKVGSWKTPGIDSLKNMDVSSEGTNIYITMSKYPDASKLKKQTSKTQMQTTSTVDGLIKYVVDIYGPDGTLISSKKYSKNSITFTLTDPPTETSTYKVVGYYTYNYAPVQSNSITKTVTVQAYVPPEPPENPDQPEIGG